MWNKLIRLFRKPKMKRCDLTIEEAMILTGAKRVILYPELEERMDEARAFCELLKYGVLP